jgi:hypothetical protein
VTLVTVGSGAILALMIDKLPSYLLGVTALPMLVLWLGLFRPLRSHTIDILKRLKTVEKSAGYPGHFL